MLDYNGFGYTPDYGMVIHCGDELLVDKNYVVHAACFSEAFRYLESKTKTYHGIYTLRCRKHFEKRSGNYCSLTKDQVAKIVRYMRTAFDMGVKFTEDNENFIFIFDITGLSVKHKFILTFSRVFFEYPFNEFAKDVLRLREIGVINGIDYTHKSFIELYNIVCATYHDQLFTVHQLFLWPNEEVTAKIIQDKFKKELYRVHDVCPGSEKIYRLLKSNKVSLTKIDWDKKVESRITNYSEKFQILKEYKYGKGKKRRRAGKAEVF